jgi:hypothetical protein
MYSQRLIIRDHGLVGQWIESPLAEFAKIHHEDGIASSQAEKSDSWTNVSLDMIGHVKQ